MKVEVWLADWHFVKMLANKKELLVVFRDIVTPKKEFADLVKDNLYVGRALKSVTDTKRKSYTIKDIIFTKKIG